MWYSGSKYEKIGALVKASYKQLKAALASGVKKLGPASITLKLGKFPLFDSFFDFSPFDLVDFWDLADFWLSDLLVFGSTHFNLSFDPLPLPTSPTSLAESIFTPSILLASSIRDSIVVFSIDVSDAAILLKLLINQQ